MKNLMVMILFFLSFKVNAQIEKGRFIVGGNISPYYSKNIYPTYNIYLYGINSSVKAGYFLFKNFVLGLNQSTTIEAMREKDNNYGYSLQTHGLGMFTRYYFLNFKKVSLFGEGALGIQIVKTNYKDNSNSLSSTNTGFNYSAALGMNYFVTHNVALELSVNYNYTDPTSKSSSNLLSQGMPKISSTKAFIGFLIFL